MRNQLILLVLLSIGLTGCQSMGEHYSCLSHVDKIVPAQIQEKYVRTETNCSKIGDFMTCSTVPIYENIILNKAQRDAAYQQCRNSYARNRVSSSPQSSGFDSLQRPGDVMSINEAKALCTRINGFEENTPQHTSCVLRAVRGR